tara:strand:+ start:663 stop:1361 length:699 start_codon:yes stop_codon:yes gene_type:complete
MSKIDILFNVYSDTPKNKDPDTNSPTLRKYHQILWSKVLPNGNLFEIDLSIPKYLHHESDLGTFILSSDSICHTYSNSKAMKKIINKFPREDMKRFFTLASTIGAYIIFPAKRVDNKMTINGARGLNKSIKDRFDITLFCIRNFYENKASPLSEVFERYREFFELFDNFKGYVDFFLLNDLLNKDSSIKFFLPFKGFHQNPLPENTEEYLNYKENVQSFINLRNDRIRKEIN